MRSTIDSAGRIVIPRDIRNAIGLQPGTVVEIGTRDGTVTIEPAPADVRVIRKGKLWVAVIEDVPPMSEEAVRATRDEVRRRR